MKTHVTPIPWTADQVADATGGTLVCGKPDQVFPKVSIDSRQAGRDDLFVAIKGERHDGHAFIHDLIDRGSRGVVIQEKMLSCFPVETWRKTGVSCIAVRETTRALGDMAAFQKKRAGVKLIAITGSCGKTTTRAMTAAIFQRHFETLSTKGNFNNEIGLPLTLLGLGHAHEWAVVELGMNSPGEISRLGAICRPDIGIITNVGKAHLEGLGSLENIARAKGELLETIKAGGVAVLNGEDSLVSALAQTLPQHIRPLFFGFSDDHSVRATSVAMAEQGVAFDLKLESQTARVNLISPGLFMVTNALAAASAAMLAGLTAREIARGLEAFRPVTGRMNIEKSAKGFFIIDDTYNANPASMEAAIKTLNQLKGNNRAIVVTGDMLELGRDAETLHKALGRFAAQSGTTALFSTGAFAGAVAQGALKEGMGSVLTGSKGEILHHLKKMIRKGDWILVKGSRGMAMEEVVMELTTWK